MPMERRPYLMYDGTDAGAPVHHAARLAPGVVRERD
jgi:hypothetical protein